MEEINYCTVDGKDYLELERLTWNGQVYVFLTNELDATDFFIRKVKGVGDDEKYLALDSEEEFTGVMNLFIEKHSDLIENNEN